MTNLRIHLSDNTWNHSDNFSKNKKTTTNFWLVLFQFDRVELTSRGLWANWRGVAAIAYWRLVEWLFENVHALRSQVVVILNCLHFFYEVILKCSRARLPLNIFIDIFRLAFFIMPPSMMLDMFEYIQFPLSWGSSAKQVRCWLLSLRIDDALSLFVFWFEFVIIVFIDLSESYLSHGIRRLVEVRCMR